MTLIMNNHDAYNNNRNAYIIMIPEIIPLMNSQDVYNNNRDNYKNSNDACNITYNK